MKNENPPINCPFEHCQKPIKHVPAGVSKKTSKVYDEFWSCSNYECDFTWKPSTTQGKGFTGVSNDDLLKELKDIKSTVNAIEANIVAKDIPTSQSPDDKELI